MANIQELHDSIAQFEQSIADLDKLIQDTPDQPDLVALREETNLEIVSLRELVREAEEAEKKNAGPDSPAPQPAEEPKWSKKDHPAFQPGYKKSEAANATQEPAVPIVYNVNDMVQAKYKRDKTFYPAKITSKTGSSADPVYVVLFTDYGNTEQVRTGDLRPLPADSKKRKADAPASAPVNTSSNVISGAADVDPDLASKARAQNDGTPIAGQKKKQRPNHKISSTKRLEGAKSSWQDFMKKGGKKGIPKDSQFRTKEGEIKGGGPPVAKPDIKRSREYRNGRSD